MGQLLGIFASHISTIPDFSKQHTKLTNLCELFAKLIGIKHTPWEFWDRFSSAASLLTSRPELRPYVVDAVREVTAAIANCKSVTINCTKMNKKWHYTMGLRDKLVKSLAISTKTSDIPRLLVSHHVQSPGAIRRHALLLRNQGTPQN